HRYIGIALRPHRRFAQIAVFLSASVTKEIEATNLVRTIRLTKSRADAAVVNLDIQPFVVMYRRRYRTHRFAGCGFAVHAGNRLKTAVQLCARADLVTVDPQPVHLAAEVDLLRADNTDIVFGLTGNHA